MGSLAQVFTALNRMREDGIVGEYAIGGATAVLFYAEPTRTYDVDVFVVQERTDPETLLSLSPIYDWAGALGFPVDSEHILIHGVPVQLLPAFNALVVEAVEHASVHHYEGTPVRVVSAEHLIALALQAGGARRRERAWLLLQGGVINRERLRDILSRHGIHASIPDDV